MQAQLTRPLEIRGFVSTRGVRRLKVGHSAAGEGGLVGVGVAPAPAAVPLHSEVVGECLLPEHKCLLHQLPSDLVQIKSNLLPPVLYGARQPELQFSSTVDGLPDLSLPEPDS